MRTFEGCLVPGLLVSEVLRRVEFEFMTPQMGMAYLESSGTCMYRTSEGYACGIGVILSDGQAQAVQGADPVGSCTEASTQKTPHQAEFWSLLGLEEPPLTVKAILGSLQSSHDHAARLPAANPATVAATVRGFVQGVLASAEPADMFYVFRARQASE